MKKIKWSKIGLDVDSKPHLELEDSFGLNQTAYLSQRNLIDKYNAPIPVKQEIEYYNKLIEWYVWFEGRIPQLRRFYRELDISSYRYLGGDDNSFWRKVDNENRLLHIGIPKVISSAMAELMMSDGIVIECVNKKPFAVKELEQFIVETKTIGLDSVLYEAAVNASWSGTGFVKWDFNEEVSNYPLPTAVSPLNIRIFSRHSIQYRADVFYDVKYKNGRVYRQIEVRELIYNKKIKKKELHISTYTIRRKKLYYELLSTQELLKQHNAVLNDLGDITSEYFEKNEHKILNTDSLLITPIQNKSPNPIIDARHYGISDYFGVEEIFDALDEVMSHLMDGVRKNKSIRYIPKDLWPVDRYGRLKKPSTFKLDYVETEHDLSDEDARRIHIDEPDLDIGRYIETYREMMSVLLINVGLTPYTVGMSGVGLDGRDLSDRRERYSTRTRAMKQRLWQPCINKIVKDYAIARDLWVNNKPSYLEDYVGLYAKLREYNIPTFEARAEYYADLRRNGGIDVETMVDKIYIQESATKKRRMVKNIASENRIDLVSDDVKSKKEPTNKYFYGFKQTPEQIVPLDTQEGMDKNVPEKEEENNKKIGLVKQERRGR